jgi:hypothetical protein
MDIESMTQRQNCAGVSAPFDHNNRPTGRVPKSVDGNNALHSFANTQVLGIQLKINLGIKKEPSPTRQRQNSQKLIATKVYKISAKILTKHHQKKAPLTVETSN